MRNRRIMVMALILMAVTVGIAFAAPVKGAIVAKGSGYEIFQNSDVFTLALNGAEYTVRVLRVINSETVEIICSGKAKTIVSSAGKLADYLGAGGAGSAVSALHELLCAFR
jgi:hypothetical protein